MSDSYRPYNPLGVEEIARSIETTLLQQTPQRLAPESPFDGAGIYAIYYTGSFELYSPVSNGDCHIPLYVGKASPKGGRRGNLPVGASPGKVLFARLMEHQRSVEAAENLEISDFRCRYLVIDELFIGVGEKILIQHFSPVWNQCVDGFGNHDPGGGRRGGMRPAWDTLHPGRRWSSKQEPGKLSEGDIVDLVRSHFDSVKLPPEVAVSLPKPRE